MTLPASLQKLITVVVGLAVLTIIAIALYYDNHSAADLCSKEKAKACLHACFDDPDVLMGMDVPAHLENENSTLLACLHNCPNLNTCEGDDSLFQAIPRETQVVLQFRDATISADIYLSNQWIASTSNGKPYVIQNLISDTSYSIAIKEKGTGEIEIVYLYTLREDQHDIDQEIANVTQIPVNETLTEEWDKLFYSSFLYVHVNKHRIVLTIYGCIPHDHAVLEVYRDDEQIGFIDELSFTDRTMEPGKVYYYSVRGSKNIPEPEIEQRRRAFANRVAEETFPDETVANEILANETFPGDPFENEPLINETLANQTSTNGTFTNETTDDMYRDTYQLERSHVETVESIHLYDSTKVTIQAANEKGPYYVKYMTFIPWQYIENPMYVNILGYEPIKTKYFNGNNRGFLPTLQYGKDQKHLYKTWTEVKIDFTKKTVSSGKDIGTTIGYDKNMKRLWQDEAKNCHIGLTSKDLSKADRYSWSFSHSCGNPWPGWSINAFAPDIDYFYQATVYKNGDWELRGQHDGCPSHEIYIAREGKKGRATGWQTMHRTKSKTNFIVGLAYRSIRMKVAGKTPR
jgi:hypothetical protein